MCYSTEYNYNLLSIHEIIIKANEIKKNYEHSQWPFHEKKTQVFNKQSA